MASDESPPADAPSLAGRSAAGALRTALADALADPDRRTYYAAFLGLFAVVELYERAVPLFAADLGLSAGVIGLGFGAARAAEVVASPASGVAADEHDRAAVAGAAAAALAACLALFALVRGAAGLVALMAGVALARLFLSNSVTPAVSGALASGREGVGWAVRDVSIYLGSALGLAAGGVLVARLALRGLFPAMALVALAVAAATWRRRADAGLPGPGALLSAVRAARPPSPADLPRPGVLARFCGVEAAVSLGAGMSLFLLPVLAVDLGVGAGAFLALFSASHVAAAPLSVAGGLAADRFARKRLYVGNYLAETAMLALFGLAGGPALFVAGLALFVVQTGFEPAVLAYFFDQFDDADAGTAWAVEGTVAKAAGVVAPVAGGLLYDLDPHAPFLLGAGLLAVGTGVALTLPRGSVGS